MKPSSNGLLAQVSTAHLVSHLYIMAVPAPLPLLPSTMQVGFVELGIAIGLFNIVSALSREANNLTIWSSVIRWVEPFSGYLGTWRQGFESSGRYPHNSARLNIFRRQDRMRFACRGDLFMRFINAVISWRITSCAFLIPKAGTMKVSI